MSTDELKAKGEDELAALRRRVEELEPAAVKLEALSSLLADLVLISDQDGNYVEVFLTEGTPVELVSQTTGKRFHDFFPVDIADRLLAGVREALATGQMVTLDYVALMPGGEMWFSARLKRLTDTTVLWCARDVTAARRLLRAQDELQGFLRELSTPLVPLADGVIAMPLIGMIDRTRAQEATQCLLEGIVRYKAHTAILDITGVKTVDVEVAGALIGSAQAARLLGTQLILTGISPDMAQALVALGTDMSGIVTRGNLQDGIAHALAKRRGGTEAPPNTRG